MDYLERSLHSKIRFVRDAGAMLLISTSSSDMMDGAPESEASLWGGRGFVTCPCSLPLQNRMIITGTRALGIYKLLSECRTHSIHIGSFHQQAPRARWTTPWRASPSQPKRPRLAPKRE